MKSVANGAGHAPYGDVRDTRKTGARTFTNQRALALHGSLANGHRSELVRIASEATNIWCVPNELCCCPLPFSAAHRSPPSS